MLNTINVNISQVQPIYGAMKWQIMYNIEHPCGWFYGTLNWMCDMSSTCQWLTDCLHGEGGSPDPAGEPRMPGSHDDNYLIVGMGTGVAQGLKLDQGCLGICRSSLKLSGTPLGTFQAGWSQSAPPSEHLQISTFSSPMQCCTMHRLLVKVEPRISILTGIWPLILMCSLHY